MSEPVARQGFTLGAGSARDILVATAIAGAIGYTITVAAGTSLGNPGYLPFAAFWSLTYVVVGALAGVQHETTRAARAGNGGSEAGKAARGLFWSSAAGTVVLVAGSAFLWAPTVFDHNAVALTPPVIVGALGYLAVCVAAGILAGLASWRLVAAVTIADAALRLAAVLVALALTDDVVVLAWCVAMPFALVGGATALVVARIAKHRFVITATVRALAWNATRTVATGAAMAVLITGFPAVLVATSAASESMEVTSIVFAANLARSPLIVVALAFQLVLVQRMRDAKHPIAIVVRLVAGIVAAGAMLTVVALWIGPEVLAALSQHEYTISRGDAAVLVASAVPVAALVVTGAALLGRGRHGLYLLGWAVAGGGMVVALAMPVTLTMRVALAILVAPAFGLAIHAMGIARLRLALGTKN